MPRLDKILPLIILLAVQASTGCQFWTAATHRSAGMYSPINRPQPISIRMRYTWPDGTPARNLVTRIKVSNIDGRERYGQELLERACYTCGPTWTGSSTFRAAPGRSTFIP